MSTNFTANGVTFIVKGNMVNGDSVGGNVVTVDGDCTIIQHNVSRKPPKRMSFIVDEVEDADVDGDFVVGQRVKGDQFNAQNINTVIVNQPK